MAVTIVSPVCHPMSPRMFAISIIVHLDHAPAFRSLVWLYPPVIQPYRNLVPRFLFERGLYFFFFF